jgi:outer membrane protein OmpA-like peptidoglycan-associated protein
MKTRTTLILLFITTVFFGQSQQTGEIVISKSHLISVLKKFKTHNEANLVDLNNKNAMPVVNNDLVNDSVKNRIRFLENELHLVRIKLDEAVKKANVHDTIRTSRLKTVVFKDTVYVPINTTTQKERFIDNSAVNHAQQLKELNSKYEVLLRNQEKLLQSQQLNANFLPVPVVVASEKVEAVGAVNAIDDLTVVADSIGIPKAKIDIKPATAFVSVKNVLKEKYAKVQVQVFFANNDTTIEQGDVLRLQQFANNLKDKLNLLVYLEGYSSKKGNADYNNKLSLARNEAVKQFLIKNGVSVKRILSQHYGVDESSSTEAMSRRVDVSFIIEE